jgi:hypothetical protein
MNFSKIFCVVFCFFCSVALADPIPTSVSERGTLIRDGKEIFPFGIYHVAWIKNRYEPARIQDAEKIAAQNLDSIVTSLDPTTHKTAYDFLKKCNDKKMGVVAELYMPSLGLLIDHMKNEPAILAWQIGDDFNVTNSSNYATPQALKQRYDLAKKHDSNHVTYGSGGTALVKWYRTYRDYHGCIDMVGLQSYPVGNVTDFPEPELLEDAYKILKARVSEFKGSSIVPIANLQSFSWKEKPVKFPTVSETRNMLYSALDAGVKGVFYYTFYDGKNMNGGITLPEQDPALWAEIGKLGLEVKDISPFILGDKRIDLKTGNDRIHASLWGDKEERLLIVFNTERKDVQQIKILLPELEVLKLTPRFSDGPHSLKVADGALSGSMKGEEVHVYNLTLKTSKR